MSGVAQEGADGDEPQVAAPHAVAALLLQMIEKAENERRVQIGERKGTGGWWSFDSA